MPRNRRALGKFTSHFTDVVVAEWDEMQELADFLNGFCITVGVLSKEKDVTAYLLPVLRCEIGACLTPSTKNSQMVRCMKERMHNKFDHRFPVNEHSVTASLLDPWFQNLTVVENYTLRRTE